MNEMQKQIIMKLAGDPALLEEFLNMTKAMEKKPVANEATVALYAVKRHTYDGKEYYHPVVMPAAGIMTMPTDDATAYTMVADKNMMKLQKEYKHFMDMMASQAREDVILLVVPETTYHELEEKLTELVGAVFDKIDEAAKALDALEAITGHPMGVGAVKANMLSEVMRNMKISGHCLNEEMAVEEAHEYVDNDRYEDDYDDYDDYNDYDDCDVDCECADCPNRHECKECDDCDDYGDCPCTC